MAGKMTLQLSRAQHSILINALAVWNTDDASASREGIEQLIANLKVADNVLLTTGDTCPFCGVTDAHEDTCPNKDED